MFSAIVALLLSLAYVVPDALGASPSRDEHPELLLSQSYFIDRNGTADFVTVLQSPFTRFEGTLSKGSISGAVWLKLRVAASPADKSLVIMVEPPFLQRLELYDPSAPDFSALQPDISGRDDRLGPRHFEGINSGFVIEGSDRDHDVFIRITSSTSIIAGVRILTLNAARAAETEAAIFLGAYLSILMLFLAWGAISLVVRRESIYGYFILRQVSSIAHAFVFFGLLRFFFPEATSPEFRASAYAIVIVTIIAFSGLFDYKLISLFNPARMLRRLFGVVISLSIISVVLVLAGHQHEAIFFNQIIVYAAVLTLFLLAWSAKGFMDDSLSRLAIRIIRIGYTAITVTVLLPVMMYLNLIPVQVSIINLIFIHAIVSNIVLLTLLTLQSRQRDMSFQEANTKMLLKDAQLRSESKRREDKERFLSMIIHELRNPLNVVHLLADRSSERGQSIREAVNEMAQVIEKVEQSEKLSDGSISVEKTPIYLTSSIRNLMDGRAAAERWEIKGSDAVVLRTDIQIFNGIMTNLIDNAEKYSPDGSMLRVSVEHTTSDAGLIIIEVSNEVEPLDIPDVASIFERYYRSKAAHRMPGSGLGLYLVRGWVDALGGTIDCAVSDTSVGNAIFSVTVRLTP